MILSMRIFMTEKTFSLSVSGAKMNHLLVCRGAWRVCCIKFHSVRRQARREKKIVQSLEFFVKGKYIRLHRSLLLVF